METILIIFLLIMLILVGVPIGTSLGVTGVAALFCFDLGIQMAGVNFISGIASFPLLATPFFVLAGVILERAGLAAIIARFFELLVGRKTGGLAMVTVLTCMCWGALSGSGIATTAAVSLILLVPMVKQGYNRNFAAATIANASGLSIVIPPSIAFIIYGSITNVPVGALFLAGIIPGLLSGIGLLTVAYLISRKCGYKGSVKQGSVSEMLIVLRKSIWALLTPIIILGGIYAGIFTPTEAAVVAVFYSLFIAFVIYRTLTIKGLIDILVEAAVTTSIIMFIVAFAGIFSWAAATMGLFDNIAKLIVNISPNAVVMILLVNLLLLVLGMFLDAVSITYLMLPILIPVLNYFGIDQVWYGVVFVSALAIGQVTPPVGVNLLTAASLAETTIDGVSKAAIPYILVLILFLIIISLVPSLSLFLPRLSGLSSL